ncbi:MAG: hypothetical protein WA021_03910 [Minisyncoccia bacterium]
MRRLIVAALVLPLFAFAQSDELRAQIRADLMQDPRASEMSETEMNALIGALAAEAESSGSAESYMGSKAEPTFTYDPPIIEPSNPYLAILTAPIMIAILSFIAVILGLVLLMRHKRRAALSNLQNS